LQQLEFFDIPSPCIGVCQSGPTGYCLGCYRSRDERLYWIQLDDLAKRTIIKACVNRGKRAQVAKRSNVDNAPPVKQANLWEEPKD
jgi:uncharacterized protein